MQAFPILDAAAIGDTRNAVQGPGQGGQRPAVRPDDLDAVPQAGVCDRY